MKKVTKLILRVKVVQTCDKPAEELKTCGKLFGGPFEQPFDDLLKGTVA